ncbi:MAG: hypothetical protein ACI9TI_000645, partial [Natronomonas sp.]
GWRFHHNQGMELVAKRAYSAARFLHRAALAATLFM